MENRGEPSATSVPGIAGTDISTSIAIIHPRMRGTGRAHFSYCMLREIQQRYAAHNILYIVSYISIIETERASSHTLLAPLSQQQTRRQHTASSILSSNPSLSVSSAQLNKNVGYFLPHQRSLRMHAYGMFVVCVCSNMRWCWCDDVLYA